MKDPCEDMTKEEIRIVFGICIKALKINSNFDRLCIGAIYLLKLITAIITTLSFLEYGSFVWDLQVRCLFTC